MTVGHRGGQDEERVTGANLLTVVHLVGWFMYSKPVYGDLRQLENTKL